MADLKKSSRAFRDQIRLEENFCTNFEIDLENRNSLLGMQSFHLSSCLMLVVIVIVTKDTGTCGPITDQIYSLKNNVFKFNSYDSLCLKQIMNES